MKPFTYLFVDLMTIAPCLAFSFHKRIRFDRQLLSFLKACAIVAVPFILWDIYFAKAGIWWFDTTYTVGITIAGLPLEEWLFFVCIPFSCVFTFFCLDRLVRLGWADALNNLIVFAATVVFGLVALLHQEKTYTLVTAMAALLTLLFLHFVARAPWIGRASLVFSILMLGFFPVNGVLTGTGIDSPIVNYSPKEFLGIRMLTIPIEDAVYGYTQFLLILYFFKMFQKPETDAT
ncbi:lycopene cyclase domain-containing protein [Pedobacter sp. ASV12]|uniref:lycopene cyclase domain-containing protein n=1 Tax=Pedobacter sp. ASV12 TaxID=2795120 RepID=UPI0018EAEEE4|nr:lycopene cyclase domain-containing protein [Pedobacter sp. ASV12]